MAVYTEEITVNTSGKGTYELSEKISQGLIKSGLNEGTVTVFCQHTSCSLVIMENADPTVRIDLENYFDKLVPENNPDFTHTMEGPDDMPSHIKMALTRTVEVIPFTNTRLCLGTWQGIFLWEHRRAPHERKIILTFSGI